MNLMNMLMPRMAGGPRGNPNLGGRQDNWPGLTTGSGGMMGPSQGPAGANAGYRPTQQETSPFYMLGKNQYRITPDSFLPQPPMGLGSLQERCAAGDQSACMQLRQDTNGPPRPSPGPFRPQNGARPNITTSWNPADQEYGSPWGQYGRR